MPIKSYLLFPKQGFKNQISEHLQQMTWCDVMPASNRELLVLVTDTSNEQEEQECLTQLHEISEIRHFALVSGFEENKKH